MSDDRIPSPRELGFPAKFSQWRKNQEQAIRDALASDRRFVGQALRLGGGKSAIYVALALLTGRRTMILTSTKALQSQLLSDFGSLGLVEMKGKANYQCGGILGKNCEEGMIAKCPFARGDLHLCNWGHAKMVASEANIVTTNYACWMSGNRYSSGFGHFDMLVMDEAHNAEDALSKALRMNVSVHEITGMLQFSYPDLTDEVACWKEWAVAAAKRCELKLQALKERMIKDGPRPTDHHIRAHKQYSELHRKLSMLSICRADNWVVEAVKEPEGFVFDPKSPGRFAEQVLFRGIDHVLMFSGTIRPYTLQALDVPEEQFEFFEYPTEVRLEQSPLYYIPTVALNYKSFERPEDMERVVARVDEIIESRLDRRGIIHTSSHRMAEYLKSHSQFAKYMFTNEGEETHKVIQKFKHAELPAVMVSPSLTTGYDFPARDCRYQIIVKLPYPDTFSSKAEQERCKYDPRRGLRIMWQNLAQAFGRADRSETDWQECFVIDNQLEREMFRSKDLAPPWLPQHYIKVMEVPQPSKFD